MRLLFIADGRSPTALNWIQHFVDSEYEVHLVSTFDCNPHLDLASFNLLPVALSTAAGDQSGQVRARGRLRKVIPVNVRTALRQRLGPFTLPKASRRLQKIVQQIRPDLVHAMRIPYEGMLAAQAELDAPLLVSVWGNDFTLHAPSTRKMKLYTQLTLEAADALHTDCYRDMRLAQVWGFPLERPHVVLPGGGGIRLDLFKPGLQTKQSAPTQQVDTVINPRGFRAYVRNDAFFQAIPLVLSRRPNTRFLCPTMANERQALRWIEEYNVASNVALLPHQTRSQMAALYQQAQVVVSPSTHDGTPNTLLEAMACGCFPVVGDIESLREWITPGFNGLLVNPGDPQAIAEAILVGLSQEGLLVQAKEYNLSLVAERADYRQVMKRAGDFYRSIVMR